MALNAAQGLQTRLQDLIPAETDGYENKRLAIIGIVAAVHDGANAIWPQLQNMTFTGINHLDDCVIVLNRWNEVLQASFQTLDRARLSLQTVELKQFKAYSAIQEFIVELSKVVSRCLLRLGQLAPPAQ
jgi:hypothetical protein